VVLSTHSPALDLTAARKQAFFGPYLTSLEIVGEEGEKGQHRTPQEIEPAYSCIELITNKNYLSRLNADSLACQNAGLTNDIRIGPGFNTAALARRPSRCQTTALKPRAQSKRCPISA
jgi:hypothetical protein